MYDVLPVEFERLRLLLRQDGLTVSDFRSGLEALDACKVKGQEDMVAVRDLSLNLAQTLKNRGRLNLFQLQRLGDAATNARTRWYADRAMKELGLEILRVGQQFLGFIIDKPDDDEESESLGLPVTRVAALQSADGDSPKESDGASAPVSRESHKPHRPAEAEAGRTPPSPTSAPSLTVAGHDDRAAVRRAYILTARDLEQSTYDERDLVEYLGVRANSLTPFHADQLANAARTKVGANPQDAARLLLQAAKVLYERGSLGEQFNKHVAFYAQYAGRRFQRESPRKDHSASEYFREAVQAMETWPLSNASYLNEPRRATISNFLTSIISLHDSRYIAVQGNPYEPALSHVFVEAQYSLPKLYGDREGNARFRDLLRDMTVGLLRLRQISTTRFLSVVQVSPEIQSNILRNIRENAPAWFEGCRPAQGQRLVDVFGELQRHLEQADARTTVILEDCLNASAGTLEQMATRANASLESVPGSLHSLDREHLMAFRRFLQPVIQYYSAGSFSSRRGSYEQARGALNNLKSEIRMNPTRLAVGSILPALDFAWSIVKSEYNTRKMAAAPRLRITLLKDQLPLSIAGGGEGTASIEAHLQVCNEGEDSATEVLVDLTADVDSSGASIRNPSKPLRTIEGHQSKVFAVGIALSRSQSYLVISAQVSYWYDGQPVSLPLHQLEVRDSAPVDLQKLVDGTHPPYSLEAVTQPERLLGRKTEITKLMSWFRSQTKAPLLIHGQRRVGKSSVAKVFANLVNGSAPDYAVCYFEWLRYSNSPVWSILRGILQDQVRPVLREYIPKRKELPPLPSWEEMQVDPCGIFLEHIEQCLALKSGMKILFVIDEFDAIANTYQKGLIDYSFFLWLRGVMNMDGMRFVFVGGEGLPNILNDFGQEFNRNQPLYIDHLDPSGALDLVMEPVVQYLTFSPTSFNRIYDYCDGNPGFSTWLAIQVLDVMHSKREGAVSIIDVEHAVKKLLTEGLDQSKVSHYWDKQTVMYDVLRGIADACYTQGQGRTLFFREFAPVAAIHQTAAAGEYSEKQVRDALDLLDERRVLVRKRLTGEGWAYRIRVGLFAEWLMLRGSHGLRGIDEVNVSAWEGDVEHGTAPVLLGDNS